MTKSPHIAFLLEDRLPLSANETEQLEFQRGLAIMAGLIESLGVPSTHPLPNHAVPPKQERL